MSIPVIDLSNPDIVQLAEQVKNACSVTCLSPQIPILTLDMGIYVSQKPRNPKLFR
jgi:hypothetical protein